MIRKIAALLLGLAAVGAGIVFVFGPGWVAPVRDFPQGPGGAIAYISLYNQLHSQSQQFWQGGDVRLVLTQTEFSGLVSSALLSGRPPDGPVQKVRAGVADREIQVDTVLHLHVPALPARLRGPIGLQLSLQPEVTPDGLVSLRVNRAAAGRIPIPLGFVRTVARAWHLQAPGFDPEGPSIRLPLAEMIAGQMGRPVAVRQFQTEGDKISLLIHTPTK